MIKPYTQKNVDFVEVDVQVAGLLPEHGYKMELSEDGMSLIWRRAIPDFLFESKWMVSMLKSTDHPD